MAVEINQPGNPGGYAGKILRANLSSGQIIPESPDEITLRRYLGGSGLGAKYLYDEVPPEVKWSDPENRLMLCGGPLSGTRVPGSGTFSVVTKGALTEGATATQANGFFSAYLKFSGFDGIVFQGKAPQLVYLLIRDGKAEIRDARHLVRKDFDDVESTLRAELGVGTRCKYFRHRSRW